MQSFAGINTILQSSPACQIIFYLKIRLIFFSNMSAFESDLKILYFLLLLNCTKFMMSLLF